MNRSQQVSLAAQLSASLLHELATPLQAILSNAEAARHALGSEPKPDAAALLEIVEDLNDSALRASHAVSRLRELIAGDAAWCELLDSREWLEEAVSSADYLAAAGERRIERQRRMIEEWQRIGRDVTLAKELLQAMEWSQREQVERRDRLRAQLASVQRP